MKFMFIFQFSLTCHKYIQTNLMFVYQNLYDERLYLISVLVLMFYNNVGQIYLDPGGMIMLLHVKCCL